MLPVTGALGPMSSCLHLVHFSVLLRSYYHLGHLVPPGVPVHHGLSMGHSTQVAAGLSEFKISMDLYRVLLV